MTKKARDPDLETLLKTALKDDLPRDLEARLEARIRSFRRGQGLLREGKSGPAGIPRSRPDRIFGGIEPDPVDPAAAWRPGSGWRRALFPALAALIIVLTGGFLQVTGAHSGISADIARMGAVLAAADSLLLAGSMNCRLRSAERSDGAFDFTILWDGTSPTAVEEHDTGGVLLRRILLPGPDSPPGRESLPKDLKGRIPDWLLSPRRLARFLTETPPAGNPPDENPETGGPAFSLETGDRGRLLVFLEPGNFRPRRILKFVRSGSPGSLKPPESENPPTVVWEAIFTWSEPGTEGRRNP